MTKIRCFLTKMRLVGKSWYLRRRKIENLGCIYWYRVKPKL